MTTQWASPGLQEPKALQCLLPRLPADICRVCGSFMEAVAISGPFVAHHDLFPRSVCPRSEYRLWESTGALPAQSGMFKRKGIEKAVSDAVCFPNQGSRCQSDHTGLGHGCLLPPCLPSPWSHAVQGSPESCRHHGLVQDVHQHGPSSCGARKLPALQ